MKARINLIIFIFLVLYFHISQASILSEVPMIAKKISSLFKKNSDEISEPLPSNFHLNDPSKLSPPNISGVERPLSDFTSSVRFQFGRCITRKLSADPKSSTKEAEEFCKNAFYRCIEDNRNSIGFKDSKCLSTVNEGG